MIYFSFLLLQSNCIFSLSTAVVPIHCEIGRKRGKTPPNKQDVGLPGIIITCWACQYNAICSLLSRSAEIPASFVQNSCSSPGACANPHLSAMLPNLMKVLTKEGWIGLTHAPGWNASAFHVRLSWKLLCLSCHLFVIVNNQSIPLKLKMEMIMRVVRHRNRLSREAVDGPPLEVFKDRLDDLSNLV